MASFAAVLVVGAVIAMIVILPNKEAGMLDQTTAYPMKMDPMTLDPITSDPTTSDATTMDPTTLDPTTTDQTTKVTTTKVPTTTETTKMAPTTMAPTTSDPAEALSGRVENQTVEDDKADEFGEYIYDEVTSHAKEKLNFVTLNILSLRMCILM